MSRSLGQQMARTMGIFQALLALPAMIHLASWAMWSLFEVQMPLYDFIASTFNASFAASIIFIVFVQRSAPMSALTTLYFEYAKSGLATAMWLWLLLDCLVGPDHWGGYRRSPKGPRVLRAGISVIVVFMLYYPTLVYALYEVRSKRGIADAEVNEEERSREREPLLRQ